MIDRLTAIEQKFSSVREAHANGEIDILNPAHHASWSDVDFLLSRTRQLREALQKILDHESASVASRSYWIARAALEQDQ